MRDIRRDIIERLESLLADRTRLQTELEQLATKEVSLRLLLDEENRHWGDQQPLLPEFTKPTQTPLARFILDLLSDGREHTTDELVTIAHEQNVPLNTKAPKRAMHFACVSLKRRHAIDMVRSGVWRIGNKDGNSKEVTDE